MTVWFASLGLEVPDVARLLQHKLHTRPHTLEAFWNKMKRINEEQVGHGYPPLCNPGMVDWDKAAVDDFLIRQTNDTYLLKHLLWFGHEHICLLATVCPGTASLDTSFANKAMMTVPRHTSTRNPGHGGYPTRVGRVSLETLQVLGSSISV